MGAADSAGFKVAGEAERWIAGNLRALMEHHGENGKRQSERVLEKLSGVSQKTINNVLHARGVMKISTVDRLARAYGLRAWQLMLTPPRDLKQLGEIGALVEHFIAASDEGQNIILGIAEREAKHREK